MRIEYRVLKSYADPYNLSYAIMGSFKGILSVS